MEAARIELFTVRCLIEYSNTRLVAEIAKTTRQIF